MTDIYIDRAGKNKPQWMSTKGFMSWSRKRKILVFVVAVVAVILVFQFVFNKPVAQEGPYTLIVGFTQELYAEGDGNPQEPGANMVVFPYSVLLCCSDNGPETVFKSILGETGDLWIFEDETWRNWNYGQGGNTLHEIKPYISYFVIVDFDCTLQISCWD